MAGQYQYLFTPIRIGRTTIANRVSFALVARHVLEGSFVRAQLQAWHSSLIRQFFPSTIGALMLMTVHWKTACVLCSR